MALMYFLAPILLIGVLTTYTDLKSKKIYNHHLILGAFLGIIATAYTAAFRHESALFHIINGLAAFLIGFVLHRSSLWRGGDAKLFTLYAFLMPMPVYSHILFPSVVDLFACSFIAGTVILLPVFIKDIVINRQAIANDLFLPARREYLFHGTIRMIFYSWILFPVYYLARITNPVIILTILYLFFSQGHKIKKEVQPYYISEFLKKFFFLLSMGFVAGLLMRLLLSPDSLSFPALARYLMVITMSAVMSICIHTTFNHFKDYHERVPFAPLLLMGCLLSYTPFLTGLMHLVTRWNVLLYR